MYEAHMLAAGNRARGPLWAGVAAGYISDMAIPTEHLEEATQINDADDVRRIVRDRHIEFLFAQFVDMHGKPSAKLVPAHHLDDLLTRGRGVRRIRGRRHRSGTA